MLLGDQAVHRWYRFVLAYPPHLVRDYLSKFGVTPGALVLDPFCGTGTTLVECQKRGISSVGLEANPVVCFASRVKTDWTPDPDGLLAHARLAAECASDILARDGVDDALALQARAPTCPLKTFTPEQDSLTLANSISPLPLHKTLVLLEVLDQMRDDRYYDHERLVLANVVVQSCSNLRFGPEVGVGKVKSDAAVVGLWLNAVRDMRNDLALVGTSEHASAEVHCSDARLLTPAIEPESVDAVITSPPYPNEKDYTRTTRLESVLLGFIQTKADLREQKRGLVRSNTRGVYQGDDDDAYVAGFPSVQRLADGIEARRIELGKTSGFERMYARVTRLYFGGMAKHLAGLRRVLRPGARLAYVVGDQASYLRIMIRTSEILAEIAGSLGYEVLGTDLFRTRFATATQEHMREDVLMLRWPGE